MIKSGRAFRKFRDCVQTLVDDGGTIADLGTPQKYHKALRPFETILSSCDYRAYGYAPEFKHGRYNCDGHQDIMNLTFEDESIDAVICLDVLEHVENPFTAAANISRIVRPGGKILISYPFLWGYHGKAGSDPSHAAYPDHWRVTHTGLANLFPDFREKDIWAEDGPIEFRMRLIFPRWFLHATPVRTLVDWVDRPALGRQTSRHIMLATK